jgi:hypothetical protein
MIPEAIDPPQGQTLSSHPVGYLSTKSSLQKPSQRRPEGDGNATWTAIRGNHCLGSILWLNNSANRPAMRCSQMAIPEVGIGYNLGFVSMSRGK